jgi:glycosyltransferase involved in cell wall biosynthesis
VSEEEKTALYRNASLLVFPSLQEGFGLPPLEAMLHGCPVVASSASCIPEVCSDAAHYIDPGDVDSIAEGMYQVATNEALRNDLIARGLQRARMFSWKTSAEGHVRLFRSLLDRAHGSPAGSP